MVLRISVISAWYRVCISGFSNNSRETVVNYPTKTSTRSLLLVLAAAWCLTACGKSSPAGYGGVCDDVADCGGETPICSEGACVECTGGAECGGGDPVCTSDGLCAECDGDADCPASAPFCDSRGECVECETNAHCGVAQPVCMPNGRCEEACTSAATCENDELCHPDLGACAECADDNDCVGNEDGPLCDPVRLRCVDCLEASHCGVASPFCIDGDCEECIQNTDCGVGHICDNDLECRTSCTADAQCDDGDRGHCILETGTCVECEVDAHCTRDQDQRVCIADRCEECRVNEDCPLDNPICDLENNECNGG